MSGISVFKQKAPKDWSINDTKAWLEDFKGYFEDDTQFDFGSSLNIKGSLLVQYSKDTFKEKSPVFGSDLFDNLQSLIKQHSQVGHLPTVPTTWTFGDTVANNQYYHIDFKHLQLDQLKQHVYIGGCYLIQGPYRSGKTSHMIALKESIKKEGFFPIDISFSPGIIFWNEIVNTLVRELKYTGKIEGWEDFKTILHKSSNILPQDTKLVLMFDEFQLLEKTDHTFKEDFLATLKTINDQRSNYFVHCVMGFGTFQLTHIETGDDSSKPPIHSPFPYSNVTYIQPLPRVEVKLLLSQWASNTGLEFDSEVLDDIYQSVGGYAGLLGLTGLTLQNNILSSRKSKKIDVDDWLTIRQFVIDSLSTITNQFNRIIIYVNSNPPLKHLLKMLIFQRSQQPYIIPTPLFNLALLLADHGILTRYQDPTKFYLSSPLLIEFLINSLNPIPPICGIPLNMDIEKLVISVISCIEPAPFHLPESQNTTTRFASEYTLQAEFFSILSYGLKSYSREYISTVEAKSSQMGNERADILLRNGKRIIFEMKSLQLWSSIQNLIPSVQQGLKYASYLKANEVVILNLVSTPTQFSNIHQVIEGKLVHVYEIVLGTNSLTVNIPIK